MYCSHCGKELKETALMCPNCGALTKNAPSPVQETKQEETQAADNTPEEKEDEKKSEESVNDTQKQEETAEDEADKQTETESEEIETHKVVEVPAQNPFYVPGLEPPKMPDSYLTDMQNAAVDYGVVKASKPARAERKRKRTKLKRKAPRRKAAVQTVAKEAKEQNSVTRNPATLSGFIMSAIGFLFGFILISLILGVRGGDAFLSVSLAIVNITLIPALIGFILSVFGFCRKNTDYIDCILFIFAMIFSSLLIAYYFIALCVGIC